MNNTIGAHFQTYKNRTAVTNAISSFRLHYPEAPIRMVSDAGEDFSDLAEKYNFIFDYENENIYPKAILIGHPIWKKEASDYGARVWLRRLYDTCKKLDTDWIVFLEDDVFTVNTIKSFPTTTAAGCDCSPYRNELLNYLHNNPNVDKRNDWWGYGLCGGGIMNRQFMVDAYEKYINDIDFNYLYTLDERITGWPDILINSFISLTGGTYSSGWIGVGGNLQQWPNAAFLHGDKSMYEEIQGSLFNGHTEIQ